MKTLKVFMVALMASATIFIAKADNDKPISVDQLPANSREFIQTHFRGVDISYAKVEQELFDKSYEIFFVTGAKVEFNKKGEWKEVDCLKGTVPAGIIPAPIKSFVDKNHPGQQIVQIDKDRRDYEIELSNGLEIKFDLKYNVIGYDD